MRLTWRLKCPNISSQWLAIISLNTILPSLFSLVLPKETLPSFEFTPRYLLYPPRREENNAAQFFPLISLLLAPWTWPEEFKLGVLISRVLQTWMIWKICKSTAFDGDNDKATPSGPSSPTLSLSTSTSSLSPTAPSSPLLPVFRSLYTLWLLIALIRTLLGHIFSRGVGWAYPALFSHWSLYETSSGFGPSIVALLFCSGLGVLGISPSTATRHHDHSRAGSVMMKVIPLWIMVLLFVGLESAAWTYSAAIVVGCLVNLIVVLFGTSRSIIPFASAFPASTSSGYQYHLVLPTTSTTGATSRDGSNDLTVNTKASSSSSARLSLMKVLRIFVKGASTLLIIVNFRHLTMALSSGVVREELVGLDDHRPLLEILILTYPRPTSQASLQLPMTEDLTSADSHPNLLTTTINSYLPYLRSSDGSGEPSIVLSVFTHAVNHTEFDDAKRLFLGYAIGTDDNGNAVHHIDKSKPPIRFFRDTDEHPHDRPGQYLHLAEAFRWVSDAGSGFTVDNGRSARAIGVKSAPMAVAEWVMLVEDDFPLCGEQNGWDGIVKVLNLLEGSRLQNGDDRLPMKRGGFVGTGGSGLIIHRTLLPILESILRLHSSEPRPLPPKPNYSARPADLIVQDCLLGADPLCSSSFSPPSLGAPTSSLVITSRMVMDHIGGMVSTTKGKTGNSDKWRCGWRHPFHGRVDVEVVVVD